MTPKELFEKLNNDDRYSYYKKGRKYVYYSTGGWSDNEELISELRKKLVFQILLVKWEAGGHYTFKIPPKELMNHDYKLGDERTIEGD